MIEVVQNRVFNVLFICTGNSARSIIAEAVLNRAGQGRFRAFSAGSQPKGKVHPYAIDLLKRLHYDVSGVRSKSWLEFSGPDAPKLDFAFTLCDDAAAEICPVWPGQPMTAHWGIEDPAAVQGTDIQKESAFDMAFYYLERRISLFRNLPLKSLDQLALGARLRGIGQTEGASRHSADVA